MTTKQADSVIFLHIPKAAGTTLQQIINRHYPKSERYAFDADAEASIAAFKALPEETKRQYRLISGHMGFGLHQYMSQPTTYITILRDPVERVISYYHHILRNPPHYLYDWARKNNVDFEKFSESQITTEIDNGQTRLLAGENYMWTVPYGECTLDMLTQAKRNLQNHFSVVGIANQFDKTLILLKLTFGWDDLFYVRANVTKGRPEKKSISPTAQANIERDNQFDIQLYQFAQQLLNEQISRQGLQFTYEYDKFRFHDRKHDLQNRLRTLKFQIKAQKHSLEKRMNEIFKR